MNKVAIVGANSYIARNLIFELRSKWPSTELFLYDYNEQHKDGCENYLQINILDKISVRKINFDCDAIYMFVGKTGTLQGFDDFKTFIDINECALLNLLQCYVEAGSKAKIIFPSTRLIYKGDFGKLDENAQKEFKTVYAMNKYACERYLEMYNNIYDVRYAVLRICVPYGTMIPEASSYGTAEFMLSKAKNGEALSLYGDGKVRRTLTYIEDLCEVLIECGDNEKCKDDVFNVGGETYSLEEMAVLIASKYNVTVEYVPYPKLAKIIETGDTVFDDRKLRKIIAHKNFEGKFVKWIESSK